MKNFLKNYWMYLLSILIPALILTPQYFAAKNQTVAALDNSDTFEISEPADEYSSEQDQYISDTTESYYGSSDSVQKSDSYSESNYSERPKGIESNEGSNDGSGVHQIRGFTGSESPNNLTDRLCSQEWEMYSSYDQNNTEYNPLELYGAVYRNQGLNHLKLNEDGTFITYFPFFTDAPVNEGIWSIEKGGLVLYSSDMKFRAVIALLSDFPDSKWFDSEFFLGFIDVKSHLIQADLGEQQYTTVFVPAYEPALGGE